MMKSHRHRGILSTDIIMGLALIAVIGVLLATAIGRHSKAYGRLSQSRITMNLAEQTMIALQSAKPPPQAPQGVSVKVKQLADASGVQGMAWVQVDVSADGRGSSLTGLAPAGAASNGGAK